MTEEEPSALRPLADQTPAGRLLQHPLAYRLWQAPFAGKKLAPLLRHNDLRSARRVLDVGCGPAINTRHFAHADYIGLDVNRRYIDDARARWSQTFICADLTTWDATSRPPAPEGRYDLILCNSFFHHVDAPAVRRILSALAGLVARDGHVHILDLVLPSRPSVSRILARLDRGAWPRPLEEWRALVGELFEPVVFEPYSVGALGVCLWQMVYIKGRARRS